MAEERKQPKKGEEQPSFMAGQEELRKLVRKEIAKENEEQAQLSAPSHEFSLKSREFRQFQKETKEQQSLNTFFEKICRVSGKIVRINIKKRTRDENAGSALFYWVPHSTLGSC